MDYRSYYRQASTRADELIAEGNLASNPKSKQMSGVGGFSSRQQPSPLQRDDSIDMDVLIAKYMADVRKSAPPPKTTQEQAPRSSGQSSSPTRGKPVQGEVGKAREALAVVESGGRYDAVGPVVNKGMYKGQRAYGKYQVMEGNIGPWSQEILGRRVSKDEFVSSPEIQDAIVEARLQQAKDKHGTWEDAASVWFSGRPLKGNTSSDGYNTVPEYVSKFRKAFEAT